MKEEGPTARVPTASEVLSLNIPSLDSGGPLQTLNHHHHTQLQRVHRTVEGHPPNSHPASRRSRSRSIQIFLIDRKRTKGKKKQKERKKNTPWFLLLSFNSYIYLKRKTKFCLVSYLLSTTLRITFHLSVLLAHFRLCSIPFQNIDIIVMFGNMDF